MPITFKAVSLSHHSAPVEIRELIYLPQSSVLSFLGKLQSVLGIQEGLVFSTCNRTEIYYLSEEDLSEKIIKLLCLENQIGQAEKYFPYFKLISEEEEAIRYLFEVSMGLESKVIGDIQISSQIKAAYSSTNEAGMAGAFLHRLLHTIFHANKRVQQETPYRDGAASVSYAAAELAEELTTAFPSSKALVLGLGEMGRDVADNLDPTCFEDVFLCNRTRSKAETMAETIQASVLPIEELTGKARKFDVIISSVSVNSPILTKEHFEAECLQGKFLIDLSVPRSIDRNVEEIPGVILYDIDDIQNKTSRVVARRLQAIPQVKNIIGDEVTGFLSWRKELSLSPTIHKLKEAFDQIRKDEMARYLKQASEKERELVEHITLSMVNKFVKLPVLQLKAACQRGEEENLIGLLNDLFNLESRKEEPKCPNGHS